MCTKNAFPLSDMIKSNIFPELISTKFSMVSADLVLATDTDFFLSDYAPEGGFQHLRYPNSFRTCLLQVGSQLTTFLQGDVSLFSISKIEADLIFVQKRIDHGKMYPRIYKSTLRVTSKTALDFGETWNILTTLCCRFYMMDTRHCTRLTPTWISSD